MKKKNLKTVMIALGATLLGAAMIQGCGSSSGGAVAPVGSSISNGLVPGLGGVTNSQLYSACSGMIPGVTGVLTTSTDGTQVCGVQIPAEWTTGFLNSGVYLSSAGGSGVQTNLSLVAGDQLSQISITGSVGSQHWYGSYCSSTGSLSGEVDGYVPGMSAPVVLGGSLSVPSGASGSLIIGLNSSPSSIGCMDINLSLLITRCVDSSGNTHPCPSVL